MAKSSSGTFLSRLVRRRFWVQAGFLLVWLDPLMLRLHTVCGPVFHCYSCPLAAFACPIGVMANFSAIHVIPFLAIGTLMVVGAGVGSLLCGWVCPFGWLQDLLGRVPLPKVQAPRWSGYFRYVVLGVLVVGIPYLYGESNPLFFCSVCPAGALEGWLPNATRTAMAGGGFTWANPVKVTILVLVLLAMLVKWRPWCRILCPLGGIFGLFNRGSLLMLRYNRHVCTNCGACESLCKYGVVPSQGVNSSQCLRCLECTTCKAISVGSVLGSSKDGGERGAAAEETVVDAKE